MKVKCTICKRQVGIRKGVLSKHRAGRSKASRIKPLCCNSEMVIKPKREKPSEAAKVQAVLNRAARRAAMQAEKAAIALNTKLAEQSVAPVVILNPEATVVVETIEE